MNKRRIERIKSVSDLSMQDLRVLKRLDDKYKSDRPYENTFHKRLEASRKWCKTHPGLKFLIECSYTPRELLDLIELCDRLTEVGNSEPQLMELFEEMISRLPISMLPVGAEELAYLFRLCRSYRSGASYKRIVEYWESEDCTEERRQEDMEALGLTSGLVKALEGRENELPSGF